MKKENLLHKVEAVGVWVETPGQAFTVGEGIARVLMYLIESWSKRGLKVKIFCSEECAVSVKKLFHDLSLDRSVENLQFETVRETSWLAARLHAVNVFFVTKFNRNKDALKERLRVIYFAQKAMGHKLNDNKYIPAPDLNYAAKSCLVVVLIIIKMFGLFIFRWFFERLYRLRFFQTDYRQDLISKAIKFKPDIWYVPRPDWQLATKLGSRVIWAFWDFIPAEALVHFSIGTAVNSVKQAAGSMGEIVTMSNYVRVNHCMKIFGVVPEKVRAKQPPFHLSVKSPTREDAAERLPTLMREWVMVGNAKRVNARYIVDFPFDKIDFIFMPTQIRGYKNFYNVVLAIEEIIRRKRIDIKLVTTGDLNSEYASDALKYIQSRGLVFDILSVPGLSTEALNCFFKLSKVVICPAFAEGGVPLSFMEGVAHGAPTIISKMPNVLEFLDLNDPVAQKYSFDPSSVGDIVDSLVFALNNGKIVNGHQQKLLKNHFNYTWDDYSQFVLGEVIESTHISN